MSHKTEIYGNYLRKWNETHAGMVQPEVTRDYEQCLAVRKAVRELKPYSCSGKAIGWNHCEGVYQMPDGRMIELGVNEYGTLYIIAVFPDLTAWHNYSEPMSPRGYFEEF